MSRDLIKGATFAERLRLLGHSLKQTHAASCRMALFDAAKEWERQQTEIERALEENVRLRFWLDVATSIGCKADHSQDDRDRAWHRLACEFSNEHLPGAENRIRLEKEYAEAVREEIEA